MTYFVSPTWRKILIKAREEYGDKVIYYLLSYHKNVGWDYFRSIFYSLPPKDRTNKKGLTNTYWKLIEKLPLLKEAEYLTVKFSNSVEREISLYDFVFVICFFKLIYDDNGYFSFRSVNSEFDINKLKDNLIDLVDDEFAKEDMNYRHNFPFCNRDMMKPLIRGCLGYSISEYTVDDWAWVDNQFEDAGIDVSDIQGKLWFEEFWDPKNFKIKLMNWKRLPF